MANGICANGSGIGGIVSIIEHEQNGLLVEPSNSHALAAAMQRLWFDKDLQERLIQGGYKTVQSRYSWANIAEETLPLYENYLREYRQR